MSAMFIGDYTFKVDAKGRMSIPAPYRRELEQGDPSADASGRTKMVLVFGHEGKKFLEVYTMDGFRRLTDEINAMPRGSRERQILSTFVLGMSVVIEVDGDGRLVLPQRQRAKIGLENEAYFIGVGETFQIWKPETFEAENARRTRAVFEEMGEDFDPLALLGG